jgi:hypothetical protein
VMSENCWLELVLAILATYRVAQLITLDDGPFMICDRVRRFLGRRPKLREAAELFHCPYCLGVWLAGMFALVMRPGQPVLWWLAVAGGQAVLEELRCPHTDE